MYGVAIWFALITQGPDGRTLETHGTFAELTACESAASIVEQSRHPLPAGHTIQCIRRAEVNVAASYTEETN